MKIIFDIALLFAGIFLLYLTYRMYKKEWKAPTWICALLGVLAILSTQGWVQGFFKTGVLTMGYEYGERLNKFQDTVGNIEKTLQSHQDKLDTHQRDIDTQHTTLSETQSKVLTSQKELSSQQASLAEAHADIAKAKAEITAAQKDVVQARTDLADQERQLADISVLTKSLFTQMRNDTFKYKGDDRVTVGQKEDGGIRVFYTLAECPIPETIRIQHGTETLRPGTYKQVKNNVIFCQWVTGSEKTIMDETSYVSYVADPTKSNQTSVVSVDKDGTIFIDGAPYPLLIHKVELGNE